MSNIFNRSYRFYEKGAPYPGICSTCSNTERLWDVGMVRGTNQGLYICDPCLTELSLFAGFITRKEHENLLDNAQKQITALISKLDAAPALIRKLNENVSDLLADFVTDLAAITSKPITASIKTPEASTDDVSEHERNESEIRKRKKQGTGTSPKSTISQRTYRISDATGSNPQH